MSFFRGLTKTAGDVIDMQKWKSDHPLHKVKRGMRALGKIRVPPTAGSYLRVAGAAGGLGLLYGGLVGGTIGGAAERKRRQMALLEHKDFASRLGKKKQK